MRNVRRLAKFSMDVVGLQLRHKIEHSHSRHYLNIWRECPLKTFCPWQQITPSK